MVNYIRINPGQVCKTVQLVDQGVKELPQIMVSNYYLSFKSGLFFNLSQNLKFFRVQLIKLLYYFDRNEYIAVESFIT